MRYFLLCCLVAFSTLGLFAAEDAGKAETPSSLTLSLSQDPAFGFYPSLSGSIGLNKTMALTFYGVFWTQDLMGGNNGGLNLMTEFGAGLSFTMADGALVVNPNLGLANGNFQSGGGRPVIGDNIVPSLYVTYSRPSCTAAFATTYWKGLRREAKVTPYYDLLDYNLNLSYNLSNFISVGLFYDHLLTWETTVQNGDDNTKGYTSYLWLGPSMKFTVKSGASMWFSFGADLVDYMKDEIKSDDKKLKDYYKLSASFPF